MSLKKNVAAAFCEAVWEGRPSPSHDVIRERDAEIRDLKSFVVKLRGKADPKEWRGMDDLTAKLALRDKEIAELRRCYACGKDACDARSSCIGCTSALDRAHEAVLDAAREGVTKERDAEIAELRAEVVRQQARLSVLEMAEGLPDPLDAAYRVLDEMTVDLQRAKAEIAELQADVEKERRLKDARTEAIEDCGEEIAYWKERFQRERAAREAAEKLCRLCRRPIDDGLHGHGACVATPVLRPACCKNERAARREVVAELQEKRVALKSWLDNAERVLDPVRDWYVPDEGRDVLEALADAVADLQDDRAGRTKAEAALAEAVGLLRAAVSHDYPEIATFLAKHDKGTK